MNTNSGNQRVDQPFVLGVDLDGVCADFYGYMREIVAEWHGVVAASLPEKFEYGLAAWGVDAAASEYQRIHRFAVTERGLFKEMKPIKGARQALQRLSNEGVHIRIITHRLFIPYFHQVAVSQTVSWLDHYAFPYRDLCFMEDKVLVDADVYIEDTPKNLKRLEDLNKTVITFTNPTNVGMAPDPKLRANDWDEAEDLIRTEYYKALEARGTRPPERPGLPLPD